MSTRRVSEALVETGRAPRYLTQLCRHFAQETNTPVGRIHVQYDDEGGSADFGWVGICTMQAQTEGLRLWAAAGDPLRLRVVQRVMTSHLERFGRRDGLVINWSRARWNRSARNN